MKKLKDVLIIAVVNIVLFSAFSIVAEQENKLFTATTKQHIEEYTDFTKEGK